MLMWTWFINEPSTCTFINVLFVASTCTLNEYVPELYLCFALCILLVAVNQQCVYALAFYAYTIGYQRYLENCSLANCAIYAYEVHVHVDVRNYCVKYVPVLCNVFSKSCLITRM